MSITLEAIKAEHTRLAGMIAAFEAQTSKSEFLFSEAIIELAAGEHYAGLILGKNGESSYHLVLLPGEAESVNWEEAKTWAKGQGGELPTRREQSLLFANLKDEFASTWYWSCQKHESDDAFVWYQDFTSGDQYDHHELSFMRARAVRRLVIE